MKKLPKISLFLTTLFFAVIFSLTYSYASHPKETVFLSPLPTENKSKSNMILIKSINTNNFQTLPEKTNILLLGLDARKGDASPRCDAIHMITIDNTQGIITITSVPRGTIVNTPGVDKESDYISNACHYMGIKYAVDLISKITGITPDYTVKVGFSQTLGILRMLELPTTPALEFLRNRSLPYGDNQRSHDQALFIKDIIAKHASDISSLPQPLRYILYQMVDTDMPYNTAETIFDNLAKEGTFKNPGLITLVTKPDNSYNLQNLHFDPDIYASGDWMKNTDYENYQKDLETYLDNLLLKSEDYIASGNVQDSFKLLNVPFSQQLWLQIDATGKRNDYHYRLLTDYVLSNPDKTQNSFLVEDFVKEMKTEKQFDFETKGENLLKTLHV
ncbi:LCP family protein [Patescibacteria group bacterium]|nr:LCP family protein [Patescibacteria group bacterium]